MEAKVGTVEFQNKLLLEESFCRDKGKRYWEWRLCQPSENVSNMLKIND